MNITLHHATGLSAEANHQGDSAWIDLLLKEEGGAEYTVTLFFKSAHQGRVTAYADAINAVNARYVQSDHSRDLRKHEAVR